MYGCFALLAKKNPPRKINPDKELQITTTFGLFLSCRIQDVVGKITSRWPQQVNQGR
jgi:hypothetical protein